MDKYAAFEQKLSMWHEAEHRCTVCGKFLPSVTDSHLAHIIPKGYVKIWGEAVIHHPWNMRITCPDCNCKVLMSPAAHPIEAQELVEMIKEDLSK